MSHTSPLGSRRFGIGCLVEVMRLVESKCARLGVQPSGGLTGARGVDPCGGVVERSLSVVPEYGMRPVGLFETCDLSR
jgi:hypothetical protein